MSHSFLVLDIETIIDPELPIVTTSEVERLPAPPHHKVVVIGALLFEDYEPRRMGGHERVERRSRDPGRLRPVPR